MEHYQENQLKPSLGLGTLFSWPCAKNFSDSFGAAFTLLRNNPPRYTHTTNAPSNPEKVKKKKKVKRKEGESSNKNVPRPLRC